MMSLMLAGERSLYRWKVTPTVRQNPARRFEGPCTVTRRAGCQWLGWWGGPPGHPAQFPGPEMAAGSQLCQAATVPACIEQHNETDCAHPVISQTAMTAGNGPASHSTRSYSVGPAVYITLPANLVSGHYEYPPFAGQEPEAQKG